MQKVHIKSFAFLSINILLGLIFSALLLFSALDCGAIAFVGGEENPDVECKNMEILSFRIAPLLLIISYLVGNKLFKFSPIRTIIIIFLSILIPIITSEIISFLDTTLLLW